MKKRESKLPLLLIFMTICSLLTAYSGGDGTETNPYQIETLDDLLELSTTPSDWPNELYFSQTADIDASETQNWNDGAGFCPIGDFLDEDDARRFSGTYDGQGHRIDMLFINNINQLGGGFFGSINDAVISNMNIFGLYAVKHPCFLESKCSPVFSNKT